MNVLSGNADFFGLDIGTTGLRVVQLRGTGPVKSLAHYGQLVLDQKLSLSDSAEDKKKLGDAVQKVMAQAGITTKNVAVGLPSSKVFSTVVDIEKLSQEELAKSIRYQANSLIPTPLAESKIDWAALGDSPTEPNKVEILLSSVTNEYIESRLDMLEACGLNVIAFEPDAMALVRAVVPVDVVTPTLVLDIGSSNSDLVITMNGAPRLTRSIPTGAEAIVKSAVQSLNIDRAQAEQFVFKFGLSKDKLESQVYNAIIGTIDVLASEIEKSIKFFQTRYPAIKLDRIIVTGAGSTLPEFPVYIANKFTITVEIGNAWRNVSFPSDQQNELIATANHYNVAAGLAERSA